MESVAVERLQRRFEAASDAIETGLLPIAPLEVARLDADPINPENGTLHFEMRGGR